MRLSNDKSRSDIARRKLLDAGAYQVRYRPAYNLPLNTSMIEENYDMVMFSPVGVRR